MNISERFVGTARLLVLSLVAGLVVLFPVVQVQPAAAAIDTNQLSFNDQVCDLNTAGYEGTGSEANPYLIPDADALWEVTDCSITNSAAAYFELSNDITVSDAVKAPTSSPIGRPTSSVAYPFNGILNGNFFAVRGLSISSSVVGVGLFAHIEDASFRNLELHGEVSYTGIQSSYFLNGAGALTNHMTGQNLIERLTNSATVSGGIYVGGLIGNQASGKVTIADSVNLGRVEGSGYYIGGLIGRGFEVSIQSSMNSAAISGSDSVGGLAGAADDRALVTNGHNSGPVEGTGETVGGLIGSSLDSVTITSSINEGRVVADGFAGGLLGGIYGGTLKISNSTNLGEVETVAETAGGLVSISTVDVEISSTTNQGDVTSSAKAGGFVGEVGGAILINNSTNSGSIKGLDDVGGLVGRVSNASHATLSSVVNNGFISGRFRVGGLAGVGEYLFVNQAQNLARVTASNNRVGGLIGMANLKSDLYEVRNSATIQGSFQAGGLVGYASGPLEINLATNSSSVSATNDYAGGIVGYAFGGISISNSINSGEVSGRQYIGGLAGGSSSSSRLFSSTNSGAISGSYAVGGLVGIAFSTLTISHASNDATVSNNALPNGGSFTGGLAGIIFGNSHIATSMNLQRIQGVDFVGGLVGRSLESALIENSANYGVVTGADQTGGIVGKSDNISISKVINASDVSGENAVGGLVGEVAVSSAGEIFGSQNLGAISSIQRQGSPPVQYTAGLVAYAPVASVSVKESANAGTISGGLAPGGLVGSTTEPVEIINSFNSGNIIGNTWPGGLVGQAAAGSGHVVSSSYNVGSVTGSLNDGLVGSGFGVTVDYTYTSVDSSKTSTTPVEDMKKASTFTGFDFTNTWGFGSCTDNQGFPMLRVFAEISNYNSVSCGYTPPQPPAQNTPVPAPVLQPMPLIDQSIVESSVGTKELLTGARFELIRSASINGLAATISQLTPTSLVIEIPGLEAGIYSLDLETTNGRISYQGLIKIAKLEAVQTQEASTSLSITGLNPRSSWLNKTALAELEEIFTGQSVVTCIAYNDRPGLAARKKALSRAMHACRIADQLGLETRVFVYGKAPQLADTVKILFR